MRIPYGYTPRKYQVNILNALDNGVRQACWIVHRRGGKDTTLWNYMIKRACQESGIYYYFLPTFAQAKRVIWDGMTNDGRKMLSYIPKEITTGNPNNTEMKVWIQTSEAQSLIQLIGADSYDCFDDETEILTLRGWRLFKDLTDDDEVAELLEDDTMRFTKPTQRVEYDYDGELCHARSKFIDFRVTPNHRVFGIDRHGVRGFAEAGRSNASLMVVPSAARWAGNDCDIFEFPVVQNRLGGDVRKHCFIDNFVRLVALYVLYGSVVRNGTINLVIEDPAALHMVQSILRKVDCEYINSAKLTILKDPHIYKWCLAEFGNVSAMGKFIPRWILNLSSENLAAFLDVIMEQGRYDAYVTKSKQLVDDLQELAVRLGIASIVSYTKKNGWKIKLLSQKFRRLGNAVESYILPERYKGKVYCVTVPSGVIKVRRHGFECWSGNSVMGTNPRGVVFSEWSLMDPTCYDFIKPILAANQGWCAFVYTPRGKNHGWELAEIARKNPDDWFYELLTVEDTGVLTAEQIEAERRKGMPEDLIQQEYYCNFGRGQEGTYYGRQIDELRRKGQICRVAYDPSVPVRTYWDLGVGDSTAIWFAQFVAKEVHLINYYENSGEGLAHYIRIIDSFKTQTGCIYDLHVAPHDIQARELTTGMTRIETARKLGIAFRVAPKLSIEAGIDAVRMILNRCWFDEEKCEHGIKCLESYRKTYNEKFKVYSDTPFHDFASHGSDAFRMLAITESTLRPDSGVDDDKYSQMMNRWGWRG